MGNGFRKLKRKVRTGAVLRSVMIGLSLGIIVVAALWLLAKLTGAQPELVRYGILGGGIALVVSLGLMAFLVPSEKRLARKLDRKLGLDEKVQTLVAFKGDQSDMAQLQREDTDRILQETSTKKLRSKYGWLLAILPVLACGSLVAALVVPARGEPGKRPVDNTSWLMDVYTEQKVKDLIDYVKTSGMQEELRSGVTAQLETLLTELKAVNKKAAMQETVVDAIIDIHDLALRFDKHTTIISSLKATTSGTVTQLGAYINTMDEEKLIRFMTGITLAPQADAGEGEKDPSLVDMLMEGTPAENASQMAQALRQALETSGQEESNPIYMALAELASALETVTAATTREQMLELVTQAQNAIAKAIEQPGLDRGVEKYTINRLLAIFAIPATELPPEILAAFENEIGQKPVKPGESDKENGSSGGYVTGEFVVGSDDSIYDPNQEKQVPYGEVIRDYLKIMTDSLDGTLSPELEEMITDYFAILLRKTEE